MHGRGHWHPGFFGGGPRVVVGAPLVGVGFGGVVAAPPVVSVVTPVGTVVTQQPAYVAPTSCCRIFI